jgi:cytochrome c oxidase assembly factor CtaG
MGTVLASGYHGPPELTLTRALTEWTLDPWMLALVVLLGAGYLVGVRRVRRAGGESPRERGARGVWGDGQAPQDRGARGVRGGGKPPRDRGDPGGASPRGQHWPVARRVWFLGLGLGFLVIATMSWVGAYQAVLFYARAVQTVLLVLVVPLFLALGRPVTLVITALPGAGARIEAVIRSLPMRILTFPAITTLALVGVPFVMYFTSWYTAVFHSGTVREFTYLVLMAPGFAFFWTLLRVDPVPKEYPYAVSMWITGAEVVGDAFFGIAVIADQNLLGAPYYPAGARPWGPRRPTAQVIGGGALWILGDLVGLPFLAAQLIQLMREDESDAARIDAELDAREAERESVRQSAAPAAAPGEPGDDAAPATELWWEHDPRFTDRFKPTQ